MKYLLLDNSFNNFEPDFRYVFFNSETMESESAANYELPTKEVFEDGIRSREVAIDGYYFSEKHFFRKGVFFYIVITDDERILFVNQKKYYFDKSRISASITQDFSVLPKFEIVADNEVIVSYSYLYPFFRKLFEDPMIEPLGSEPLYIAVREINALSEQTNKAR